MIVSLIVAVSQNGVIGKENRLPWRLPADLKWFKRLTLNHPVIMGRKTFESIGKPLPDRTNIVITRQPDLDAGGAIIAPSIEAALQVCAENDETEVFVIGGAMIFVEAMPAATNLYLTLIHQDFEGDTFFRWDKTGWREVAREDHAPDAQNQYRYSFITYRKTAFR